MWGAVAATIWGERALVASLIAYGYIISAVRDTFGPKLSNSAVETCQLFAIFASLFRFKPPLIAFLIPSRIPIIAVSDAIRLKLIDSAVEAG